MVCAYIGLGSNLDDPESHVRQALVEIGGLPETRSRRHSSLYLTSPVGPQDQAEYINAVGSIDTGLAATELLKCLLALEQAHGRVRTGEQWGPRTLDLDLLLYGDEVIDLPDLKVPHPEMHRRCFVLQPLTEIDRDIVIPGHGDAAGLLEHTDCTGVRLLEDA